MEFTTEHIIIGVIVLFLIYYFFSRSEGFGPTSFCSNCHSLTKEQCLDCPNCGYGTDDGGVESCTKGDPASSYFNDKYMKWQHRDKERILKENHRRNPYNCGYEFPVDKRVRLMREYA